MALYHAFADQAPTPELGAFFEEMVLEKTRHFKKLLRSRKVSDAWLKASGLRRLPRPPCAELAAAGISDLESACRFAIRAAESALELCTTLAQMTQDPTIQRAFSDLADDEEAHVNSLRAELAKHRGTRAFLRKVLSLAFPSWLAALCRDGWRAGRDQGVGARAATPSPRRDFPLCPIQRFHL